MAKIKCEVKEDSTLVKFEAIEIGEIFVCGENEFIKTGLWKSIIGDTVNAFRLNNIAYGAFFDDDELVTYVKEAELKLTI